MSRKSPKSLVKSLLLFCLVIVISDINAQDQCKALGWANYDGQIYVGPPTGGGSATVTQVTTFSQLKTAVESSSAAVIHVMNSMGSGYLGNTGDVLNFKSNKTIIGIKPGIVVKCSWQIKNSQNIIIRNLQIQGPGNTNANQNWDAVNIENSQRVWVDHCIVMDGEDGNFDIVKGSDNVSVTWTIFTYSADGVHNLSNLIGSSDTETQSHGKLNTSYINCWWKDVNDRCPRTRYGMIHLLNCLYTRPKGLTSSNGTAAGLMANNRVENCHFDKISNPCKIIGTPATANCTPIGCKFTNCTGTTSGGSAGGLAVFTPPYEYKSWMVTADNVQAQVEKLAGNTLVNPLACGQQNTDCNGVANGSAKLDNCDRCVAGNTGKTACTTAAEAEVEACAFEGVTETSNTGFKGTSYLNTNNAFGSGITFSINASVAGNATISFRYANGGTTDRPAQVTVNENLQANDLSFPTTGSFTSWKSVDLTLNLQKGNNTIKLSSTTADGLANIDQIGYVSSGLTKGNCVVTDISESKIKLILNTYPNPFSNKCSISLDGVFEYELIDQLGKICESGTARDKVDFGLHQNKGIYFLKISNSTGHQILKVIKE